MKIIKHGTKYKPLMQTECNYCGCVFEHEECEGEYVRRRNYEYSCIPTMEVRRIKCPECNREIHYEFESP